MCNAFHITLSNTFYIHKTVATVQSKIHASSSLVNPGWGSNLQTV